MIKLLILFLMLGGLAKADVYSTCLGGAGVPAHSIQVTVEILPNESVSYTQSQYIGSSDCSGLAVSVTSEWRFRFIGEGMLGHFRNLTYQLSGEEKYLNLELFGHELLLVTSKVHPFYQDPSGEWMNHVITLKRVSNL